MHAGAGGRGRGGVLYAPSHTFRRLEEVVVAVRKEPPGELHSLQLTRQPVDLQE